MSLSQHVTLSTINYYLSGTTNNIEINLSNKSNLTVERDFLHKHKVRRLHVTGGKHFELATNYGDIHTNERFPNTEIVDCNEILLGSHGFYGESKLIVNRSPLVIIAPKAFSGTEINATFIGIGHLCFNETALSGARSRSQLQVFASQLNELKPLEMSLHEVRFENSTIKTILAKAFDGAGGNAIIFRNCQIDVIASNAFTEKVTFCFGHIDPIKLDQ